MALAQRSALAAPRCSLGHVGPHIFGADHDLGMGLYLSQRSGTFTGFVGRHCALVSADQGITIATGVSQWNDLIGTAHLIQSTGANQPAYNATDAGYNGQATVQSTATNMFLVSGAAAMTQPCSVLVVGQINTIGRLIASLGTSGALAPSVFSQAGNAAANAGTSLITATTCTSKRAMLATFNGASSFIAADNWLTAGTSGAAGAVNGTVVAAFAYSAGDFGATRIAEMIVQSGAPTAAEKAALAAFLDRYGITVT